MSLKRPGRYWIHLSRTIKSHIRHCSAELIIRTGLETPCKFNPRGFRTLHLEFNQASNLICMIVTHTMVCMDGMFAKTKQRSTRQLTYIFVNYLVKWMDLFLSLSIGTKHVYWKMKGNFSRFILVNLHCSWSSEPFSPWTRVEKYFKLTVSNEVIQWQLSC